MRLRLFALRLVLLFFVCVTVFYGVSIDALAVDETIKKMSVADTRAFFGDSISAVAKSTSGEVYESITFNYFTSYLNFNVSGHNLAQNSFANNTSQFAEYDVLVYKAVVPFTVATYCDIKIDLQMFFPDYAKGAFAFTNMLNGHLMSGITQSGNDATLYPDNRFGDSDAVLAAEPVRYYGAFLADAKFYRLFPYYSNSDGESFSGIQAQSLRIYSDDGQPTVELLVFCPHIISEPLHSEPSETTITTTTAITTNIDVNVNVDMSETNSTLSNIWQTITGIPSAIIDGIQSIFVPEDGYFDTKVAQVKAKFSWYEDIVDAWTEFKTALNGISADTPPSIILSLDNRTFFGQPIGSGSGTALVLDWMYTYRNTIRNLLSAFMWIFFIWRLYCHIPNIISGSGMEVQKTDEGAAWFIHGHKL